MFERYTGKARRAIFFARYEASQFGSPTIACEHLLLGLLRETKSLQRWLGKESPESIQKRIEEHTPRQPSTSTSVDLPLDAVAKRALKQAADEADRLAHRHIGTEHLFLALLTEDSFASELLRNILQKTGADAESVRLYIAGNLEPPHTSPILPRLAYGRRLYSSADTVEIHGSRWNADYVRDAAGRCRAYNWHWHKAAWTPRDIAVEKKTGRVSFDLELGADFENFEVVKGGWKKDHCYICGWDLFETPEGDHGAGYSNGRDWLCCECYTKFCERPDFFSSAYSDLT